MVFTDTEPSTSRYSGGLIFQVSCAQLEDERRLYSDELEFALAQKRNLEDSQGVGGFLLGMPVPVAYPGEYDLRIAIAQSSLTEVERLIRRKGCL